LIDLVGVVVGIVVGVILLIGVSVIALIVIFKKRKRKQTEIPINQIDKKMKRENDQSTHSFSPYSRFRLLLINSFCKSVETNKVDN
jgi:hypothetical protein